MKRALVLCAATLVTLTACSGSRVVQPMLNPTGHQPATGTPADGLLRSALSVVVGERRQVGVGAKRQPFIDVSALAKSPRRIAVSDASNNDVNIYNRAGTQLARFTDFSLPQGLSNDGKGNLYVADTQNQRVQVYPAGFQGQPTTLTDPIGYPSDVDSFGNGEIVAAANIYNSPCCLPGSVVFFKGGTLARTIADARLAKAFFCAFDAHGNLYVDGLDANNQFVIGEIIGGENGTRLSVLSTANTVSAPGGIQIANNGEIAILDQDANTIYTYGPPKNGSLGIPLQTTSLGQAFKAVSFSFTFGMSGLYSGDPYMFASQLYSYPGGGNAKSTINVGGQVTGIAVFPAQSPDR